MLDGGLWTSAGKTPAATVNARLAVDIKSKGVASRFVRTAKETFALNPDMHPGVGPHAGTGEGDPPRDVQRLSFTEAAARVLEIYAERRPMHYRAITDKAMEFGWLTSSGQTPEATMYSQILSENQRRKRRGEQPRFTDFERGFVGLTKWTPEGVSQLIEQHNRDVRRKLLARLKKMDPAEFEELIGLLLGAIGFEDVEVTQLHKDGGIDVRGTLVVGEAIRTRMAVQVKRWQGNVQRQQVQQVRGSLGAHEQGLIIATSDFSSPAREEAERPDAVPVGLMNGEQLVGLLVENELGVRRTPHDLVELDETRGKETG